MFLTAKFNCHEIHQFRQARKLIPWKFFLFILMWKFLPIIKSTTHSPLLCSCFFFQKYSFEIWSLVIFRIFNSNFIWIILITIVGSFCLWNSSLIRQKVESQNGGNKKTKHAKVFEKRTCLTPWYAPTNLSL